MIKRLVTNPRIGEVGPDAFSDLEQGLQIDENALDEVCREQATLFYRVSKKLTMAISRRDAAKQDVDYVESKVQLMLRDGADAKMTADEVKARVRTNRDYLDAIDRLAAAQDVVGQWASLKEAYQQRSYALNHMVDLYLASYYGNIERREGDVRTRDAEVAKEAMRRMRTAKPDNRDKVGGRYD